LYSLIVLLAILFSVFVLLRSSPVQTFLGRITANYLSDELNTEILIGKIRIKGSLSILLKDIYISDHHHNNLFTAHEIELGIKQLSFRNKRLHVNYVGIDSLDLAIIKYLDDEKVNIALMVDHFNDTASHKKPESKPFEWLITINSLEMTNSKFHFRNEEKMKEVKSMDYANLRIYKLNIKARDLGIRHDTIFGNILNLNCYEECGFRMKEFTGNCTVSSTGFTVDDLNLRTNNSSLSVNLEFDYYHYRAFLDFLNKVRITGSINPSRLNMKDIGYFAEKLLVMENNLKISGLFDGTVNDFKASEFKFSFGKATKFYGDMAMKGLPDIWNTHSKLDINYLYSNKTDLENFAFPGETVNLVLPKSLVALGDIKVQGLFEGMYNDFTSKAEVDSEIGSVRASLKVASSNQLETIKYEGDVEASGFDIGKFLDLDELGTLNMDMEFAGSGISADDVDMDLTGWVKSANVYGHEYNHIIVGGHFCEKQFNGRFLVDDELIEIEFDGLADFSSEERVFDFVMKIDHARLQEMNLVNRSPDMMISLNASAKLQAKSLDELSGYVSITNTTYYEEGEIYEMDSLKINAVVNPYSIDSINMVSDFIDTDIAGDFTITEIIPAVADYIKLHLKHDYQSPDDSLKNQYFSYNVKIKEPDVLSSLFYPSLELSPNSELSGVFKPSDRQMSIQGNAEEINLYGLEIKDWFIDGRTTNDIIKIKTGSSAIHFQERYDRETEKLEHLGLENFLLDTEIIKDSLNWSLSWDDEIKEDLNTANIAGYLIFPDSAILYAGITHSKATVNDSSWTIDPRNFLIIDTNYISFENFNILGKSQSMHLNGIASADPADTLNFDFRNWTLSNFDPVVNHEKLDLDGDLSGTLGLTDVYGQINVFSDLKINDLFFNSVNFGEAFIRTLWTQEDSALSIKAEIYNLGNIDTSKTIEVSGQYLPYSSDQNFNIDIDISNLDIRFADPFMNSFMSELQGFASGSLSFEGTTKKPLLLGKMKVQRTDFIINYLNTRYSTSIDVDFDENRIHFADIPVYDTLGNKGFARADFTHNYLKDFEMDLSVSPVNMLVMNTNRYQNDIVYGTAYASGDMSITGPFSNLHMAISAESEENTEVKIPITSSVDVSESDFIIFLKDTTESEEYIIEDYKVQATGFSLDLGLKVSQNAGIQLFLPDNMGYITATGRGDLDLGVDSRGYFTIDGTYVLNRGNFRFSLQQLVSKRFEIVHGSRIEFLGDAYETNANIQALYRVKTTLSGLGPSIPEQFANERVVVHCYVYLTENLFDPNIRFSIQFPFVESSMQNTIYAVLDTTDLGEMNRQAISLLLLNTFSYADYSNPTAINSYTILTNQLSSWLSQISNDFDIGINYLPGDEINNQELEVALSTQLFNNRLIIDGSFDVPTESNDNSSQNTSNIVGDVNIEYKLTPDGRFRVSAFNRSNTLNVYEQYSPYTQGIGLSYRKDFDNLKELFSPREGKRSRKERKAEKQRAREAEEQDIENTNTDE